MSKFKVVAYRSQRYEMVVEADDRHQALDLAGCFECVAPEWKEDCGYHSFAIDYAAEQEEE
jgi:hypothetical protein